MHLGSGGDLSKLGQLGDGKGMEGGEPGLEVRQGGLGPGQLLIHCSGCHNKETQLSEAAKAVTAI